MSLHDIQNIIASSEDNNVVMPRKSFVLLLELLDDSMSNQGALTHKVYKRLLYELSGEIKMVDKEQELKPKRFLPVVPSKKYILTITGLAVPRGRVKELSLVKDVRKILSLGLKEAKDWVDKISDGGMQQYLWKEDKSDLLDTVKRLKEYGYHCQVTFGDQVIYDSQDDNNNDLMNLVPIPF